MKFGKVDDPTLINFELPVDHADTSNVLSKYPKLKNPEFRIGYPTWNKQKLPIYPKGIKDELPFYSKQFNCIELNATYYRIYPPENFIKWYDKTPADFKFYPKISQSISQYGRLKDVDRKVDEFLLGVEQLKEKLGMVFLQLPQSFSPNEMDKLIAFVKYWPKQFPLGIEFRHEQWFANENIFEEINELLASNNMCNLITDTAGRRDLAHMRLTNPHPFIRFTGANHPVDFSRLDDWFERIKQWISQGVQSINFMVHQNAEQESVLLANYLIKKLNAELGYDLNVFAKAEQGELF